MANQAGLGDIIGNRLHVAIAATHASVASGGANSRLGQIGPFSRNIRVRHAWWTPTGADQTATATASYRRLSLVNAGAAGTGSSIIASKNLTASLASLGPTAMTVDTTVTVASGEVIAFSQVTVGATETDGTVLRAGQFSISFEEI